MELKPETKYNFAEHSEILQVLDETSEKKVQHDNAIMAPIHKGIKEYMRTRTNSELIDMADLEPCIWDYHNDVVTPWEKECGRRSFPVESTFYKALSKLSFYYNDDESLEHKFELLQKQVGGMQKKLDRMMKILGNRKITMRIKDFLGL